MRNAIISMTAGLALFATGCATMTKDTFILESAGAHTFEADSPEILDEAEKILKERGFSVRRSAEQHALVSEWREEIAGNSTVAGAMTRYMVEVFPVAPRQCRVRVTRNSANSQAAQSVGGSLLQEDGEGQGQEVNDNRAMAAAREYASGAQGGSRRAVNNATQTRDLAFEWELMKRMEPDDARELETVASEKFR